MYYSVKPAKAGVIEWFELLGSSQDEEIVAAIEHDRLDYSLRPGLVRKLLLISTSQEKDITTAGGAYFFKGYEEAREFLNWASFEHRDLQGRLFEQRDFVGERHAHVCEIIGHIESNESSTVPATVHVERFQLPTDESRAKLAEFFQQDQLFSEVPGLLSISCFYDPAKQVYFIISVAARDRNLSRDAVPDITKLSHFVGASENPSLHANKVDDMRFWVYTIWEPRERSDPAGEAVWPNSPPLPCPEYWHST